MTTPEDSSTSSFPPEIQKTKPTPSSISISKFVDDIAVGNVTAASAGAISCSAPSLRPSYLQALLGDHQPHSLLGSFSSVKDEDFPELISTKHSGGGGDLFSSQPGSEEENLAFSFSSSSLQSPYPRFVSANIPSCVSPVSPPQEEPERLPVSAGLQSAAGFPPEVERTHQRGRESHPGAGPPHEAAARPHQELHRPRLRFSPGA